MLDTRELVEATFPNFDQRFAGRAVIFDQRDQAIEFLDAVNETQRSRMRNMRRRGGLTHVSSLPLAARTFALRPIAALSTTDLRTLVYGLDAACFQHCISRRSAGVRANEKGGGMDGLEGRLRKRWESGMFVVIPDDGGEGDAQAGRPIALAYERSVVWPWVMSDAWLSAIKNGDAEPPPSATDSILRGM